MPGTRRRNPRGRGPVHWNQESREYADAAGQKVKLGYFDRGTFVPLRPARDELNLCCGTKRRRLRRRARMLRIGKGMSLSPLKYWRTKTGLSLTIAEISFGIPSAIAMSRPAHIPCSAISASSSRPSRKGEWTYSETTHPHSARMRPLQLHSTPAGTNGFILASDTVLKWDDELEMNRRVISRTIISGTFRAHQDRVDFTRVMGIDKTTGKSLLFLGPDDKGLAVVNQDYLIHWGIVRGVTGTERLRGNDRWGWIFDPVVQPTSSEPAAQIDARSSDTLDLYFFTLTHASVSHQPVCDPKGPR